MKRNLVLVFGALLPVLAACALPQKAPIGPDGVPLQGVYIIEPERSAEVQFRMLDAINALRSASGVAPIGLDAALNASAATHARDMAVQNRPWHFGSDGSSPIERISRAGYPGWLLGENISETFETELETLAAWMEQEDTRNVILDARAQKIGFSWFQEQTGKIWWTLVVGGL